MDEKEKRKKQVRLLQKNLSSIRKIAGWTAERLGEQIGVTKQTICNLENAKSPMTLTQYIAIRSVLDFEIESNSDNTVLPRVIDILVDKGAEIEEEDYSEVKETIDVVAASASTGQTGAPLEKTFTRLTSASLVFGALAVAGIIFLGKAGMAEKGSGSVAVGTASWLKRILK